MKNKASPPVLLRWSATGQRAHARTLFGASRQSPLRSTDAAEPHVRVQRDRSRLARTRRVMQAVRCIINTSPSRRLQISPQATRHSPLRRFAPLSHQCHRARLALRQRAWLVNGHGTLPTLRITLSQAWLLSELPVFGSIPLAAPSALRGGDCRVRHGSTRRPRSRLAVEKTAAMD